MAFQTSRYVFRQYQNPEFGGLYEYRWTLNAFWIIIPGVMASLAFVNPEGGYVLVGAFCYVPAEPIWYRLCLAWIPRGFVFMIILITQSAIYIYIMRNVKACQEVEEGANMCRVLQNGDPCDRSQGDTLEVSTVRPCEMKDSDLENQTSQKSEWATGSVETSVNSNSSTYPSPEDSSHEYMNSQTSNMPEKRHEVQRQAKFLFIYPLIYIIMWIFPLVSQIIQYINKPQTVPFWVSCTWGIALGAHGGVDSIIFMIRERPWTKEKAPLPNWIRRIPKKFPKVPWVRRR
jgi:G protein-coupled receptor GPR1